ncbi:MAG: hypothetical protein V7L08_35125 [Nostoc sp.]
MNQRCQILQIHALPACLCFSSLREQNNTAVSLFSDRLKLKILKSIGLLKYASPPQHKQSPTAETLPATS